MYDGDEETQDIDSDSKDNNIERFNGFAGNINFNNVSRIRAV